MKYCICKKGFTLVEVMLVVGVISLLGAIVIVAINPAKQMAEARNAQRWSNISSILNAVHQYRIENKNILPAGINNLSTEICNTVNINTASSSCAGLSDLSDLTKNQVYLPILPKDPFCPDGCSINGIGYKIQKFSDGRVTVSAPNAELNTYISITR